MRNALVTYTSTHIRILNTTGTSIKIIQSPETSKNTWEVMIISDSKFKAFNQQPG